MPHAPKRFLGGIAAAICLPVIAGFAAPDEETNGPRPAPGTPPPDAKGPKADPFRGIPHEKRERLRETMRNIWNDTAVLQARSEVATATENYQNALRNAVKRTDPEMLEVIEKIRASSTSEFKGFIQRSGGPHRGHGGREFHDPFGALTNTPPPFLKDLTEEQRTIYKAAREKATKSEAFQEALKEMEAVRQKDNELREERIQMFRRLRQIMTREMLKADERLKNWLPKSALGPGGPGGKGKGFPGKGKNKNGGPKPPPAEEG